MSTHALDRQLEHCGQVLGLAAVPVQLGENLALSRLDLLESLLCLALRVERQ